MIDPLRTVVRDVLAGVRYGAEVPWDGRAGGGGRSSSWGLVTAATALFLVACSPPPTEPPLHATLVDSSGLRYTISSPARSAGADLSWIGEITNESPDSAHLEFGACGLRVHAFRDGSSEPAWDSAHRGPVVPAGTATEVVLVCPLYLAEAHLAPGESVAPAEFALTVPVAELLGDTLPEGRFRFEAWFELDDRRVGPLDLGSGTVER